MARPMANDPPFATLNHDTADLGIPKSQTPRELVLVVGCRGEQDFPDDSASKIGPEPVTTLECAQTRLLRAPQTFLGLIQWLCPLDLNCALWVLGIWRPTQT